MKGCRLSSNMFVVRLLLGEVAFSYNFLRTRAEMISLNFGRNEVQVLLYFKITFIKSL
jgi:hypothetical protein